MGKDHNGQHSGFNTEKGISVKPVMPAENLETNEETRETHTGDEDRLPDNVKQRHPGNKTNKEDSTNTDGFPQ